MASTGGLLVVYEDVTGTHDIVMTRLMSNGSDLKPAFPNQLFNVCRMPNDQTYPQAVKTGSGELLIAWNDTRSNGGSSTFSSIYAQLCDKTPKRLIGPSPSTSAWGIPVSNRVNSNADEVVLVPRTNGGIAVWRDNRNGNNDIYAQLIFRDGSLPVELSGFSASAEPNGNVLLKWQTASEKDNAGFEIERRLISDPNASNAFELVGSYVTNTALLGAGASNSTRRYSFIDKPTQSGVYEYRLADYTLDGERTVHEPRTVELLSTVGTSSGWAVSPSIPNPFSERTMLAFTLAAPSVVRVEIVNVLGQIVATPYRNEMMNSGQHQLPLTSSMLGANIPTGTYYTRVTASNLESGEIIWKSTNPGKLSFIRE